MQFSCDILDVDLSRGACVRRALSPDVLASVLGGRGLNALTLFEQVRPETQPLHPDNVLVLSAGLLTASPAPAASRLHVGARSPLTGLYGSSNVGGEMGLGLRRNGLMSIILRGSSPRPQYLLVDQDGVRLLDAADLWGQETNLAAEELQRRHGRERIGMLLIGPAGERLVPMACLVSVGGHAAGRTGMGAVMGSKGLKAVVARWERREPASSLETRNAARRYLRRMQAAPNYVALAQHGQSAGLVWSNEQGMLASYNYEQSQFEGAELIDGPAMDTYVRRHRACHRCPVHCKADVRIDTGRFAGFSGYRPDFEPIVSLGSKCGVDDVEAVIYLHNRCDRLGLDSVSAGSAIAFAMQLSERGILGSGRAEGLDLSWGNVDTIETLLGQMASGAGLGALLGRGVRAAALELGPEAERLAYHVKGLELTGFDPRASMGTALGYAVSTRGGDFASVFPRHEHSLTPGQAFKIYGDVRAADRLLPVGKAALVRRSMIVSALLDSLGLCKVPTLILLNHLDMVAEAALVRVITGLEIDSAGLFRVGERILNLERLFNLRCGAGPDMDALPRAFFDNPIEQGPCAGMRVDVGEMLDEFYGLMGWTEDGWPSADKLAELELELVPTPRQLEKV